MLIDHASSDRRPGLRTDVERLLDLAEELAPSDRLLIRGVYERGLTASDVARIAGVSPASVQRRVRRLIGRLASREFHAIVRRRTHWPPLRRRVAEKVFLQGVPLRTAARELELSLHRVRQEVERIRGLCEQVSHAVET